MTMAQATIGLVLDCTNPAKLAEFWSEALGYKLVGEAGNYVMLLPPDGGAALLLQRVPEPKTVKNRMHLDVHVADIAAEAERLASLGARHVDDLQREEHGSHWLLMEDPEGNEFCICDAGGGA
jgi:predicted enzyme related to lactoylglutathione lyase